MFVSFSRPTPEILWYRNNVLITDSGDRFQHKLFNRTLRLGSLSSSAHDGSYKCVAVSGLLRIEANFNVKVIGMNTSCETFNSVKSLFLLSVSVYCRTEVMGRKKITIIKKIVIMSLQKSKFIFLCVVIRRQNIAAVQQGTCKL